MEGSPFGIGASDEMDGVLNAGIAVLKRRKITSSPVDIGLYFIFSLIYAF